MPALPPPPPAAEIVVTGTALPRPAGAAAYSSTTINRDRLTSDASGRIEDVLRDVAGFQQFRRTDSRAANPTSQGATLRALGGNASSRALVLLDGVPQADPFAGYIPWSALSPERLGSARVTRGGGAGAFGAGAVAGTIELFSAGIGALEGVQGRLAYGSRDSLEVAAAGAARLGGGFVNVSARRDQGHGYILTPAGQRGTVDVPARYTSTSVSLRAVAPLSDTVEIQTSGLVFVDDRLRGVKGTESDSRGADASLRLVGRGRWGFEALAYVQARRFASGFVAVAPGRATATPSLDQFNTPATGLGGKLELRPPVGAGHDLQIGADVRSAVGTTRERFRFQGTGFTRLRDAGGGTQVAGLFAEDSWRLSDQWLLTGGVRIDRWTITAGHLNESDIASGAGVTAIAAPRRTGWEPTARGGIVFTPVATLSVRAAAYRGFRLPTPNELYRPFRVGADATAANPALGLEKLTGVEGGVEWRPLPAAHLGVTAYWNRLAGAIGNVTLGQGPGVYPQVGFVAAGGAYRLRGNLDAVTAKGIEAEASLALGRWTLSGSASLADPRVSASGAAAALDGRRPANSPTFAASTTLGWQGARIDASVSARYVSAQYDDDLERRRLPGVLTIDATTRLRVARGIEVEARAENILDKRVVSGIAADGTRDLGTPRTLWLGVRLATR